MDPVTYHDTPKKHDAKPRSKTPNHTPKNFRLFRTLSSNSNGYTQSPSASLSQRIVKNPFENQLHERLHLPVISSPNLFVTATPKRLVSDHEWTWSIEEISSLNPVNVVPHETQFREEVDPEKEREAQAAISAFFTEQKIVPSPLDCNLRKQKIILKEERTSMRFANSTALISNDDAKPPLKIQTEKRDAIAQTALTFPPILPKEVEDLLKQFKMIDDETENEDANNGSMMDISTLRRKLFIAQPESPLHEYCDEENFGTDLSPPPKTPEMNGCDNKQLESNESFGSDMFGELSPIRNSSSPKFCNDVSMMSDYSEKTTPSRGFCRKLKKGKILSESFCLLENECNEDDVCDFSDEKENMVQQTKNEPRRFGRFDSGFPGDEDSKLSAENMQF